MTPLLLLTAALAQAPTLDLALLPSGAFERIKGYRPLAVPLSASRPLGIAKAPEGNLRYGSLKAAGCEFVLAVDGERLFVDSNGDGDLTNDPKPVWGHPARTGTASARRAGTFTLDLPVQGRTTACTFGAYETNEPDRLGAYADFALTGKTALGGKAYDLIYSDESATWDGTKGVLMIDKDGDGAFNPNYEFYPANEPFNVGGTTYEMRGLALVRSAKTVMERNSANSAPPDPNLSNGLVAGKAALPFRATTTGGRAVSFPSSYRGKVVLVDFWATWCGPCMREVPNVVSAYSKYHEKGFEVLGISLDREKAEGQLKSVTAKQGMVWDQVYDGRYFDARVAKQYRIQSIPATYLVDGDTGKILASGMDARGAKLDAAIKKALAARSKG